MTRSHCVGETADRSNANSGFGIGAASGTFGDAANRIQLDVRRQVGSQYDGITGLFAFFQRELVGRRVNLAEVVDTSIGLRGGAGFHKVGNSNRRQQADDGHNDHDFHQRETSLIELFGRFHLSFI